MVLLGAGLTFTPPLYPMYITTAHLLGWSPTIDQQLGGLIMWIPGGLYLIVIASIVLIQWFIELEKQQRAENASWLFEEREEEKIQQHTKATQKGAAAENYLEIQ